MKLPLDFKKDAFELTSEQVEALECSPLSVLESKKLLFAGAIIPLGVLEELFDMKIGEDEESFKFKRWNLISKIEMAGFFCTTKGMNEGFRIYDSKEMDLVAQQRIIKSFSSLQKTAHIMNSHNISALSPTEQSKHRYVAHKAANCAIALQKTILDKELL